MHGLFTTVIFALNKGINLSKIKFSRIAFEKPTKNILLKFCHCSAAAQDIKTGSSLTTMIFIHVVKSVNF